MITSEKIKRIQNLIKQSIEKIEKSENVKIQFGSCSYNPAMYRTQMTVSTNEKSDKVEKVREIESKKMGFTQNIIGMKFTGKQCGEVTITDIKTRNRKYPIIAVTKEGKGYKFTSDQVKAYLGGDKLINRNTNLKNLLGE